MPNDGVLPNVPDQASDPILDRSLRRVYLGRGHVLPEARSVVRSDASCSHRQLGPPMSSTIHLHHREIGSGYWRCACGNKSLYAEGITDTEKVTCRGCKKTKEFQWRSEIQSRWAEGP